jgi:hypothetical protein
VEPDLARNVKNHPKFDWQIIRLLLPLINSQVLSVSKHCWFRSTFKINPRRFLSLLCCSPSLPKSFSLCLSLTLSSLIPDHDLPGLISHKSLMIRMFDYHWLTINIWGLFVVLLMDLLTIWGSWRYCVDLQFLIGSVSKKCLQNGFESFLINFCLHK